MPTGMRYRIPRFCYLYHTGSLPMLGGGTTTGTVLIGLVEGTRLKWKSAPPWPSLQFFLLE